MTKKSKQLHQNRGSSALPKHRRTTRCSITQFPEARGKVVKDVEFYAGSDSNSLALMFQDNTSLSFDFATGFATEAHFSRWKDGNARVLRYWPRIHSEPIF